MKTLIITISFLLSLVSIACAQSTKFSNFISEVNAQADKAKKDSLIDEFMHQHHEPFIDGTTVAFYYRGKANLVAVPGEMNGWTPPDGRMEHVHNTDFFFHEETLPINSRVEYKYWVDSAWILDPLNPQKAMGGFGENSEVWMPDYKPVWITYNPSIPHGRLDTLWYDSKFLKAKHPVFVYFPPDVAEPLNLPSIYVTDGGDYITLGKMTIILDSLIHEKLIKPVVAVFVDPKTDLKDNSTNARMTEYAASDAYLDFLEKELLPSLETKYPLSHKVKDRMVLGASMGGLIGTYAGLTRPNFVANIAAQSPAFEQADRAVVKISESVSATGINIFMCTGTIHDTQVEARLVRDNLLKHGAHVQYMEFPEGHNWTNWRARLPILLQYFFAEN
jgi:enterochelin esterase family protein